MVVVWVNTRFSSDYGSFFQVVSTVYLPRRIPGAQRRGFDVFGGNGRERYDNSFLCFAGGSVKCVCKGAEKDLSFRRTGPARRTLSVYENM